MSVINKFYKHENLNHENKNHGIPGEKPHKIGNKTIEQESSFKYLGFNVSYCLKEDVNFKLNKFQRMCRTLRRTLRQETLQITQLNFIK
jgi:hypothetical protein